MGSALVQCPLLALPMHSACSPQIRPKLEARPV
jgi:hypothetical protein